MIFNIEQYADSSPRLVVEEVCVHMRREYGLMGDARRTCLQFLPFAFVGLLRSVPLNFTPYTGLQPGALG